MVKKLMKFVSILLIIILVFVFTVMRYYSGAKGFEKLEGNWQGTIGEETVTFEIYKGSRAIKGFTHGYLELIDSENQVISSHRIKFKDKKVFDTGDVEGEVISLNLLNEDNLLEGEVQLIINNAGEVLKGDLSATKN